MKNLQFPIWCVKYLLDNEQLANPKSTIEEVIDCYTGIAIMQKPIQLFYDYSSASPQYIIRSVALPMRYTPVSLNQCTNVHF